MLRKRPGFSLVELIVVLAMASVALPLLVPAVQKANQSAERKKVIENMKQIALAVHNYSANNRDTFPPASHHSGHYAALKKESDVTLSMQLLPYLEQGKLTTKILKDDKAPTNVKIDVYNAPQDPSTKDFIRVQNFAANVRVFTDEGVKAAWDKPVTLQREMPCSTNLNRSFPDGTSNTIMLATRYAASGELSKDGGSKSPCSYYDLPLANDGGAFFGATPMSKSPVTAISASGWQLAPTLPEVNCKFAIGMAHAFEKDGIVVGLVDGSVRLIAPSISTMTWNTALQPNDGHVPGKDW